MFEFRSPNPHSVTRTAVSLKRALRLLGVERKLATCQNAVARVHGYHCLSELVVASRNPDAPSRRRKDLAPEASSEILAKHLDVAPETIRRALSSNTPAAPVDDAFAGWRPRKKVLSKFGVVVFDEPKSPSAGWACRGGERPVRLASLDNLDPAVLWLTDAGFETFFDKTGLHLHRHLRHDKYVGVSPSGMLREIGATDYDGAFRSELAAMKFSTIMETAESLLGGGSGSAEENGTPFTGRTLRCDLSGLVLDHTILPDEISKRLDTMPRSMTLASLPPRNMPSAVFRRDRCDHAREVLAASVPSALPSGRYEIHGSQDMLPDVPSWIASMKGRTMIVAEVASLDPTADIFGHTRGPDAEERWKIPELVTGEEFDAMRTYGEIVSNFSVSFGPSLPAWSLLEDRARRFVEDASTWEEGVIAECIWRSAMSGRTGKPKTMAEPWIACADKLATIRYAERLREAGLTPHFYGHGWIRTLGTERGHCLETASRLGLSLDHP